MADSTSYSQMTGQTAQPGQIAYEGIGGGQNSLTQFIRSIGNFEGKTATDATATGKSTTGSGVDQLKSLLTQYLGPLVSGSESAIGNVLQPQTDAITAQFDKVRQMLSDTAPRGGGKASALAQQPYAKIGEIATLTNQARENAVKESAAIGTTLSQTGLTEQQLGLSAAGSAGSMGLGKAAQDLQENENNMRMLTSLGEGIGSMLGGIDWGSVFSGGGGGGGGGGGSSSSSGGGANNGW